MSKRSRTFQPSGTPPTQADPSTGSGTSPAPGTTGPSAAASTPTPPKPTSGSTSRAEARRRSSAPKASAQQSFFDRYRLLIVGGAGVVVVVLALLFFGRSSTSAYECVTFLTPPPAAAADAGGAPGQSPALASSEAAAPTVTAAASAPAANAAPSAGPAASPSPAPTPLLGFQTTDLGREHVSQGTGVRYDYCPPASGRHYNLGNGLAPLARRFYGPDVAFAPQNWIHNLEHGSVVLLYKGEPSPADLEALRGVMDQAEATDWNTTNCGVGVPNKVIAARFDDMDPGVNFAAVAWDRALLQQELDATELLAFANQWQDGPQTPERICGG